MSHAIGEEYSGETASECGVPTKAWPIRRYSRREGPKWNQVDDGSGIFTLHTKGGQLMLVQNGTVLESLPVISNGQMHGIVRDDTLLVASRYQNTARKFKVRFTSSHAALDCVKFLLSFFPIKDVTKPEENVPESLGQMYNRLMLMDSTDCLPAPDPLPASYPLEETVRMSILDPSFLDLVARVGAVMTKINESNK